MFVCEDGTLKLLDFGIAKRHGDEQGAERDPSGPSSIRTAGGVRAGTPRYMAPEQRAGAPTDARTDEYAWGLVAFELLAGVHPLGGLDTGASGGLFGESGADNTSFGALLCEKSPDVPREVCWFSVNATSRVRRSESLSAA
jgi:serine/threonine-protein kinase